MDRLSAPAVKLIEAEHFLTSTVVILELECLREIGRATVSGTPVVDY